MPISPKLQTVLSAITKLDSNGNDLYQAGRDAITTALNDSPALLNTYNDLVSTPRWNGGPTDKPILRGIEWSADSTDRKAVFNPNTGVIHVGMGYVSIDNGIDPVKLASAMAHEGKHGENANDNQKAWEQFNKQVSDLAQADGTLPHDYTKVLRDQLNVHTDDEGKAGIAGWNAAVIAEQVSLRKPALTKDELGKVADKFNLSPYDGKGNLLPGFTPDLDPNHVGQVLVDPTGIAEEGRRYGEGFPSGTQGITYKQYYFASGGLWTS